MHATQIIILQETVTDNMGMRQFHIVANPICPHLLTCKSHGVHFSNVSGDYHEVMKHVLLFSTNRQPNQL